MIHQPFRQGQSSACEEKLNYYDEMTILYIETIN